MQTTAVIAEDEPILRAQLKAKLAKLWPTLSIVADVVSLDRALVFPVAKDRPVLVTALAWADVLLTLDRADFVNLLGSACYGMPIMLPSEFFTRERAAGRI